MRIAIVTQSYHPRPGGVTEHVHHTATALRARGHTVTVVTTQFGNDPSDLGPVVRLGRNILVPVNGAWVNLTVGWSLRGHLQAVLHDLEPDVIHTHCPLAPTLPLLALQVAPRASRVVGTFHAAATRLDAYRMAKPVLDRFIRRIDTRVAVSPAAMKLASHYFPGEYTVIPNGVDCRRFSPDNRPIPELRDDAFNVLFVGRMDERKGLKYLFRAVAMLSGRCKRRIRLVVVGDNGVRRHLLPRLPPDVDLVLTGVIDKNLLPRYFATADVFCSPAVGRESFGIVLLEAMASGVPVVDTSIPGYLTLLRDGWNARVVPPRDPGALSGALEELLREETIRWRLQANGRRFAQQFSWERVVDQLEAIYRAEHVGALAGDSWTDPIDGALQAQKA